MYKDDFVNVVKADMHKCTVFLRECSGDTQLVADGVFKQLAHEMQSLIEKHSEDDVPPKDVFGRFIK